MADVLLELVDQLLSPLPVEQRRAYPWRMDRRAREAIERRSAAGGRRPS